MTIVVLSTFLVAAVSPAMARFLGRRAGTVLALLPAGHFVYLLSRAERVAAGEPLTEKLSWAPSLGIQFSFLGDGLSLTFGLLISGIGALIVLYTGAYLKGDRYLHRFYLYLLVFMGSMQGIVFADNLITLFVFWELTSVSSYLLIGHDHNRGSARQAALQALLVTGVGGLALLAGFILIGTAAGTYELSEILASGDVLREHPWYLAIVILVLAGCFTKSAQFPFHFWLPSAMAAPTPASAYLHSSTMVKAGLYLMARMSPVLGDTPVWQYALVITGALTMLVSSYLALQQSVLKPLLAYTTVSALGAVTFCLGMGTPLAVKAAMTFLVVHALYKAALFMVAGGLDHETGENDTEHLGGAANAMPLTAAAAALAGLSMAGLPPFFGFIGKEIMYDAALRAIVWPPLVLATVAVAANAVNVYAAMAVGYRPFWGRRRTTPKEPHDGPWGLWIGALVLGASGLLVGLVPEPLAAFVIGPAASAVLGAPAEVELVLWHGFNWALALSGITLAVGVAVYLARHPIRLLGRKLAPLAKAGPAAAYDAALAGMQATARIQTNVLQSGYLRVYMSVVFTFILAFPGVTLIARTGIPWTAAVLTPRTYEIALAIVILISTFVVVTTTNRLTAVAALGAIGYSMGVIFVLNAAPDLAMTQFVIETLIIIILVLVLHHLPRFRLYAAPVSRVRDMIIAGLSGFFMTSLVVAALDVQHHPSISAFHSETSAEEAHGRNVVNVILVDFRALDTLGEIVVLAIAALGAVCLLKLRTNEGDSA